MLNDDKVPTTRERVESWKVAKPLLDAMYSEFKELSKKKPDGALSVQKIRIANRLLGRCREVLEAEQSLEFLDTFDEDDVPQHSDAALILSQYVAAMQQFKVAHYGYEQLIGHHWVTED